MLCVNTQCRQRNVQATHALRWSPPNDPPGTRNRDVIEGRYCDTCRSHIYDRGPDVVLGDEPILPRTLDAEDLRRMAANATDELLTYAALRLRGFPHQTALFVSELVDSWPLILDALNGAPTDRLEQLREEVSRLGLRLERNSEDVAVVTGAGRAVHGVVSTMPAVTQILEQRCFQQVPPSVEEMEEMQRGGC